MRKRIRCFWHQESTPSLVQRKDGWYCYGVCNKLYTNKEVEDRTGEHYEYEGEDDEKEDIFETFKYIKSLRNVEYRGLKFPADERGYFIVWPRDEFYKYRLFTPGKGPKYIGPKGIKPPLFWAKCCGRQTLAVVEGEISAMSISLAFPEWDVCSPGSATMFSMDNLSKYLTQFKEYSRVVVILDEDAAGTKGLIEAKAYLLYKIPFISFMQMSPDPNDVLCDYGKDKLREIVQGANYK